MAAITASPRLCACGCGRRAPADRRYVISHKYGHTGHTGHIDDDNKAVAFHTGAADARNGRAHRVDLADRSPIGERYHAGYDNPDSWMRQGVT